MASGKPPLVLLHGIAMSGKAWEDVVPLLSTHHQVYVPTAPGHNGGPPVQRRPAAMTDVVDATERYLDQQGLERPILPATPWADLWRSSWPGVVARQPCARFLREVSGQPRTGSRREHSPDFNAA
jgi:pimeloyl-ACP methyl ester carboxylesterase